MRSVEGSIINYAECEMIIQNGRHSANPVDVEVKDDIAWITVDNPPVNAVSVLVRKGLLDAVDKVKDNQLAVLQCRGKTFIAGGDMSEFDAKPLEPHLPDVVRAIESSVTPFLVILHGYVLGGGFEVSMACAFRIARPRTFFGLPEVNVGLIAGAGGTQLAPRLVGWSMAVDMACLGKMKTAEELLQVGAIDAISDDPTNLIKNYIGKTSHPVSSRVVTLPCKNSLEDFRSKITRFAKGQKSPHLNFDALLWSVDPFAISQPKERKLHLELRQSWESRSLRHLFFAKRAVTKPSIIRNIRADNADNIENVVVVGGGLMGCGIAATCLNGGYSVSVIERDESLSKSALERITSILYGAFERGKITMTELETRKSSLRASDNYSVVADADLIIEAVFEDIRVKREVFSRIAAEAKSDAIFASNTSYLDPTEIFSGISDLGRCIGLHFFSPAHIMKLVEVVRMDQTYLETLSKVFSFAIRLGKVPVLSGICDGFIGNRILSSYRRAAEYLLADGALPQEIDDAMRKFGMAMGPFEAQDMSGLQIAETNRRRQDSIRDPKERYVPIADRLCALGRFGKGSDGWYHYEMGKPLPDATVEDIILKYSAEAGITRSSFSESDIQMQLLASMVNEGARIVDEGIAENDDVIDVVKVFGYGFPHWRGGPMYWSQSLDSNSMSFALKSLVLASPQSWVLARRFQDIKT